MRAGALGAWILLLVVAGCRSAGVPFGALEPGTSEQTWQRLVAERDRFPGARGFARITTGGRSFRATLKIKPDGSFEVNVLSPIGTTIAAIEARGNAITVLEGSDRSTRTIAELGEMLGLPAGSWDSREIGLLLMGLPPNQRFEYDLSSSGLSRVRDGAVEIRYDPPAFPPQRLTISSGTEQFELEYLELQRL